MKTVEVNKMLDQISAMCIKDIHSLEFIKTLMAMPFQNLALITIQLFQKLSNTQDKGSCAFDTRYITAHSVLLSVLSLKLFEMIHLIERKHGCSEKSRLEVRKVVSKWIDHVHMAFLYVQNIGKSSTGTDLEKYALSIMGELAI